MVRNEAETEIQQPTGPAEPAALGQPDDSNTGDLCWTCSRTADA